MATTAKQEVVNAAMAHLGEPPFDDITQDPPGARLQKVLGQLEGRAGVEAWALGRHPWLCALSYLTLAPVAVSDPPDPAVTNWKWGYTFVLPDTFVRMWEVDGCGAYEVGSAVIGGQAKKVVRANASSLNVAFTEARPFEAYTTDLCNVIALMLASRSAGPLKSDYEAAARLSKQADAAVAEAMTGEANQHMGAYPVAASVFAALRAQAG